MSVSLAEEIASCACLFVVVVFCFRKTKIYYHSCSSMASPTEFVLLVTRSPEGKDPERAKRTNFLLLLGHRKKANSVA